LIPDNNAALLRGVSFNPYAGCVTVLEIIQRSSEFLTRHGVESPRLQIELLLAHVLKQPRLKLYLNFERQLTHAELAQLRDLVKRRSQREPLQHIVGSTSFCGLEIAVNRHVLVPRPETELLAEMGSAFLESEIQNPKSNMGVRVLDFGTGSGCLAIALAVKCPTASIHALDVSAEALAVAKANAAALGVANRIELFRADGFGGLPAGTRYELIISNPPYIPSGELATLEPEVRDFDPRIALDGGADGLDFFRRLAAEAGKRLAPAGRLMCEFGDGQGPALRELFDRQNWIVEQVRPDYSGRERILVARAA
jgi:release factor glutamine methyltransferase